MLVRNVLNLSNPKKVATDLLVMTQFKWNPKFVTPAAQSW